MSFEPFEAVSLGQTALRVTRLGFGAAPIGGLYREVQDPDAHAIVRHAWQLGIRHFDVAPLYGYGNAERRLGKVLAELPRDQFVVSTKVGRVIYPRDAIPPGADVDRQAPDGREDTFFKGTPSARPVFDYSYDGVRRSVEHSLKRLGLDRVDILYIHDPDDHWKPAISEAYPALHRLREEGVVGAIGAAMDQAPMLVRFAREGDFDVFLIAGRYTLLDQEGLHELLPLCVEKRIGVVIGGVMNSGILADPRQGSPYDYRPAGASQVSRAQWLRAICDRHGVPLKAAAVQFPLAHPAVASVVAGVRRIDHLDEYPVLMRLRIPGELWSELKHTGLLPADAPVPAEPTGRATQP